MQVIRANLKDKNGKIKKGKDLMAGDCIFPFKYKGKVQNGCVKGNTGDWCATEVKDNKTVRKWAYCNVNGKKVRIDLRRTKVKVFDPTEKKVLKKSSTKTPATQKKVLKKSSTKIPATQKKVLKKSSKGYLATEKKKLKKSSDDPLSADRVLKNNKDHNQTEAKYCSCLMKVRGNSLKNEKITSPYGICTSSLYNKQDKVRMKRVRCSKYYNFNLYPINYLQAYAIEKKIPYKTKSGNMYSKAVLLKHIGKYLESKND